MKRSFWLVDSALKYPRTVIMVFMLLAGIGVYGYLTLPRERYPEVAFPEVFVQAWLPGASPEIVEEEILQPLEQELHDLEGLEEMKSIARVGAGMLILRFAPEEDLDEAYRRVQERVEFLWQEGEFPEEMSQPPQVIRFTLQEVRPALQIHLWGEVSRYQLRGYARQIRDSLLQFVGVKDVEIVGAPEPEIQIRPSIARLWHARILLQEVFSRVQEEVGRFPAGILRNAQEEVPVSLREGVSDLRALQDLVLRHAPELGVWTVKDVSDVQISFAPEESRSYHGSHPVITLIVKKRKDANLVELTRTIRKWLTHFQEEELPPSVHLAITGDLSEFTIEQIGNLETSMLLGFLLVWMVTAMFVRFRRSWMISLAIPLSMVLAFAGLTLAGVHLNTPVLFGLVLALGMLVDNAIVLVENIDRYLEKGVSVRQAIQWGAGEVAIPLLSSTLTTVIAFVPLAFWPGILGDFLVYLPITVMAVLTGSLLVAYGFHPVFLAGGWNQVSSQNYGERQRRRILYLGSGVLLLGGVLLVLRTQIPVESPELNGIMMTFVTAGLLMVVFAGGILPVGEWVRRYGMPALEEGYRKVLLILLRSRIRSLIPVMGVAGFGGFTGFWAGCYRPPDVYFFPELTPDQLYIYVELPEGTALARTDSFTRFLTGEIQKVLIEEGADTHVLNAMITHIGRGAHDPDREPYPGPTPHKARITLDFSLKRFEYGIRTDTIRKKLERRLPQIPGIRVYVNQLKNKPPMGFPISLEFTGTDYRQLIRVVQAIRDTLLQKFGSEISYLQMDVHIHTPQKVFVADPEALAIYGVSSRDVATSLHLALQGEIAGEVWFQGEQIPIRVGGITGVFGEELSWLPVPARNAERMVPLLAVGELRDTLSFNAIYRKNQQRYILLYGEPVPGVSAHHVMQKIQRFLQSYPLPPGISWRISGEEREMEKNTRFLVRAFMLALGGILLVLVTHFQSFVRPFLILTSVLAGIVGTAFVIVITQEPVVVIMMLIGLIALAGVVVNNAIVLVDFLDLHVRNQKHLSPPEILSAIADASVRRLRPILMTTITTVMGLLPLAVGIQLDLRGLWTDLNPHFYVGGHNAVFWGPLARTVIYGLTTSAFLTLFVIPTLYRFLPDIASRLRVRGVPAPFPEEERSTMC